LDEEYFTRCHTMMCQGSDKNATTFRTLFYPSLADGAIKAGVERCGQHSDYGTFTLLFQDDIGGLEVIRSPQITF
jgi:isopenicillin N synthase-like dioxygenase